VHRKWNALKFNDCITSYMTTSENIRCLSLQVTFVFIHLLFIVLINRWKITNYQKKTVAECQTSNWFIVSTPTLLKIFICIAFICLNGITKKSKRSITITPHCNVTHWSRGQLPCRTRQKSQETVGWINSTSLSMFNLKFAQKAKLLCNLHTQVITTKYRYITACILQIIMSSHSQAPASKGAFTPKAELFFHATESHEKSTYRRVWLR